MEGILSTEKHFHEYNEDEKDYIGVQEEGYDEDREDWEKYENHGTHIV